MKGNRIYYGLVGAVLVVFGAIALLQMQGVIPRFESAVWEKVWPPLFAAAGLAFLAAFVTNVRERWSAVIPSLLLLALGALGFFGDQLGQAGGSLFLGALGLSFLLVFVVRRDFWWALIPAGVLFTLGVVAWLDDGGRTTAIGPFARDALTPGIFFLGLALTFFAVFLALGGKKGRWWALITAVVLALFALAVSATISGWALWIWPALVILAGAAMVLRALLKRSPSV